MEQARGPYELPLGQTLGLALGNIQLNLRQYLVNHLAQAPILIWAGHTPVRQADATHLPTTARYLIWGSELALLLLALWQAVRSLHDADTRALGAGLLAIVVFLTVVHVVIAVDERFTTPALPLVGLSRAAAWPSWCAWATDRRGKVRLVNLVNLLASEEALDELKDHASRLSSIQLSERAMCDLELLAVGGFSPLDRFMSREDHDRVVHDMRLADGALFPIPVTLPIDPASVDVSLDRDVALRNAKNDLLAILTVDEVYAWDRDAVAAEVFGTTDLRHPLVVEMRRWGPLNVSGRLQVLRLPPRYDFRELRLTPVEVRERLARATHPNVVAFQTRNPLHRVHEELTKRAIERLDATLLLHPSVGMTRPGDVDHYTRVRTYRALAEHHYPKDRIVLALLPLAMRMAGPREAVWHALIRRNYGANYFIVGRDHASPGVDSSGRPFYGPYDAQALLQQHQQELGVTMVPFQELVYLPDADEYAESADMRAGARTASISGTQVREEYLNRGRTLPAWFTRPETAAILADAYPPRDRQGVCVWFTGLSGAGKSTTAEVLTMLLLEHGRQVTVLDGDVVRRTCRTVWVLIARIATPTSGGSASSPPRSSATAVWPYVRRSARIAAPATKCARWLAPTASWRFSWTPRSKSASGATPRACTPKPAEVRSAAGPASTIPTSSPSTPRWCSTPCHTARRTTPGKSLRTSVGWGSLSYEIHRRPRGQTGDFHYP